MISLKISTLFKNEFKGEASLIEVETISGRIGILPGHMPIIASLASGVITIYSGSEKVAFELLHGGFLKFNKNVCTISAKEVRKTLKTA